MVRKSRKNARKRAIKEDKNAEERGPTICMLVNHDVEEMNSSLNVIRLPFDLSSSSSSEEEEQITMDSSSDGLIVPNNNNISVIPLEKRSSIMGGSACVTLGSKIYLLGGNYWELKPTQPPLPQPHVETLLRRVQFIDIHDPSLEIHSVAPMNTPKKFFPCIFVARGNIYALNAPHHPFPLDWVQDQDPSRPSGLFERYHPDTNTWEILPDPPLFDKWYNERLLDCATVIDSLLFIGTPSLHAIFNLDTLTWDQTLDPFTPNLLFPYGSLFSQHQHPSLYYLDGPRVRNRLASHGPHTCFNASSPCIKRISLPSPTHQGLYHSTLLHSVADSQHTMAEAKDLDEHNFFSPESMYFPQAHLLHVGGRIFCYIITAQIRSDCFYRAISIKFFEEVPAPPHHHSDSPAIFRPLASFFYKLKTNFNNRDRFVRCSVIGNVPDSWINSPQKKEKQESKPESANKEMDFIMHNPTTTEQEKCQVENIENDDRETGDLMNLLAARNAKIRVLEQELARMKEILKTYESRS